MRPAPLVALLVASLFGGCTVKSGIEQPSAGGADIDPSTAADTYASADFLADYEAAVCDWLIGCAPVLGTAFADQAGCLDFFKAILAVGDSNFGNISDPLLYRVDADKAPGCLAAVRAASCTNATINVEDDPACAPVLIGRLNDGECCDDRGGCAPNLICEKDFSNVGHCSANGEYGETCYRQTCVEGAVCRDNECVVSFNLGAGQACDSTFNCGAGLYCKNARVDVPGLCYVRPESGEFCAPPEMPCAAGLACGGDNTFVCATTRFPAGQNCFGNDDCQSGLICTIDRQCILPGQTGAVCNVNGNNRDDLCATPLRCFDGHCGAVVEPTGIGANCTDNGPSCPGFFDEGQCLNGKCVAPGKEGDTCGDGLPDCSAFAYLVCDTATSRCKSLPKLGEACPPPSLCGSYFTVGCIGGTCQTRKKAGSTCTPVEDEDKGLLGECELGSYCVTNVCTAVPKADGELCQ